MGWVQTSDTGQVNWGSSPAVPSSTYVYEIWKPADALQTGSTQYFLKVEYGFSSSSPRIRFSVGTGTNGSGTLTGFIIGPYTSTAYANQGSNPFECYFSGDIGRMGMLLWRNGASSPVCFAVERTHNADGTDSSDGVVFLLQSCSDAPQNNTAFRTLVFGQGLGAAYGGVVVGGFWSAVPNQITFNNAPLCVALPEYGKLGNPMKGITYIGNAVIGENGEFQTTLYGATRTYIASNQPANTPASARTCLRFD
jgi:hypothetical protein